MGRDTPLVVSMMAANSFWSDRTDNSPFYRRTIEESILLGLCLVGILAVSPFAVLRIIHHEWVMAAVDTLLIIGVILLSAHVWLTRRIRHASIMLTLFYFTIMVTVVYIEGIREIYWAFPTMASAYFLIRPREALWLNLLALLFLIPAIVIGTDFFGTLSILVTLLTNIVFVYIFAVQMVNHRDQLSTLARRDPLTHTGNRRALDERLTEAVALRARKQETMSIILLDVDLFKLINDSFGHSVGDQVLIDIAETVRSRIRITDGLFRLGGDEFVITLMSADIDEATRFAESLREQIMKNNLLPQYQITVSLGIAELQEGEGPHRLMERVDEALYQAKHSGRNTVRVKRVDSAPNI